MSQSPVPLGSAVLGADGEPLVYPSPLSIRNTFIEVVGERALNSELEDYMEERKVRSEPLHDSQRAEGGGPCAARPGWATAQASVDPEAMRNTTGFPSTPDCSGDEEQDKDRDASDCSTADTVPRAPSKAAYPYQGVAQQPWAAEHCAADPPIWNEHEPIHPTYAMNRPVMSVHPAASSSSHDPRFQHQHWQQQQEQQQQSHQPMLLASAPPHVQRSAQPMHPPMHPHHSYAQAQSPMNPGHMATMSAAALSPEDEGFVRPEDIPNKGSEEHYVGNCKPCAFINTKGCENGTECEFCHICEPGEKKKRKKEKLQARSAFRQLRRLASEGMSTLGGVSRW